MKFIKETIICNCGCGIGAAGVLFFCLITALMAQQALASDFLNPFDVDKSDWVSVDRYTDREKRFPALNDSGQDSASPEKKAEEEPVPVKDEPKIAQPSRPLNLPIMPGLSQGFEILVDSTVDKDSEDAGLPKLARPLNLPVMPGLRQGDSKQTFLSGGGDKSVPVIPPQDGLWKDPKKVETEIARSTAPHVPVPFNVRLAVLPDPDVTSIPGSPAARPHKMTHKEAAPIQMTKKEDKITKRNAAAWEALNAYRKKQLAAIESDRQTLNALQAAIAELGLDKKLDFTTGAGNTMNALPKIDDMLSSKEVQMPTAQDHSSSVSPEVRKN